MRDQRGWVGHHVPAAVRRNRGLEPGLVETMIELVEADETSEG